MVQPVVSKFANKTKKAFYFPETGEKICSKCGGKFKTEDFFKHSQTQDGWHSWCKSCCREGNLRSREKKYSTFEGRVTTLLRTCKNSSKSRGQEFSLTRECLISCWEKQGGICAYSGKEMTTQPNKNNSVSVERVNNNIGYVEDNVVLVCKIVNSMKSNFHYDDFYEYCKSVADWLTDSQGNKVEGNKHD